MLCMATPQSTTSQPPVGHDVGDGSAAALVDFTEFADLPGDIVFVEDAADLGHEFGISIVAAAFSAGAGVFVTGRCRSLIGPEFCFSIGIGKDRVEGCRNVSR